MALAVAAMGFEFKIIGLNDEVKISGKGLLSQHN